MRARHSFVLLPLTLFCSTSSARADGARIDLQAFRPALDSKGYITTNGTDVLGHGEVSFGLVTSWGRGLLEIEGDGNTYSVEHLISPTLVGAVGLRAFGLDLQLGASMPFSVLSGDRGPDSDNGTPDDPNDDSAYRFEGQGLGDLGLHAKWRILPESRRGLGLSLIGSVHLPTATDSDWLGSGSITPSVALAAERTWGRVRGATNIGVRLSAKSSFIDDQETTMRPLPLTGATVRSGGALTYGGAASFAVSPGKMDLVAEVFGELPGGDSDLRPLEALGGIKLYLAHSSFLTLGAGAGLLPGRAGNPDTRAFLGIVFEPRIGDRDGDGLADDVDACPDDPEDFDGFEDANGCPELDNDTDHILDVDDGCPMEPEDKDDFEDEDGCPEEQSFDRDGDRILDPDDACPDDPEDFDGFEDHDGCPDLDNDRDGILDVDDLCPDDPEDIDRFEDVDGCPEVDNDSDRVLDADDACPRVDGETAAETAEVYNTVDDDDGCPDRGPVRRTTSGIEILEAIHFEFDSDVIKEESFPILRAVAMTIATNPDITLIEVEGHTDERGSEAYNLDLSNRRAASVRRFLVGEGVDPSRLRSQGYGESRPKKEGHGEQVWAINRRVEFIIVRRKGDLP